MSKKLINNDIYNHYGDRWYTAKDDPIALLRAEGKTKNPYVHQIISSKGKGLKILDVGCGAGFLTNYLASHGELVTGVDLSKESLEVAKKHDTSKTVNYIHANATKLPFPDASFDVVTCMDFLEHVDIPEVVVAEISRVLKKDGLFIFHTFNRNILSKPVVIKGVELLVKNTPKHLHVYELFIKPSELTNFCLNHSLHMNKIEGIRPRFNFAFFKSLFKREIDDQFSFKITSSTLMGYLGYATKG